MTTNDNANRIGALIAKYQSELLEDWIANLRQQMIRFDANAEQAMRRHCRQLLELMGNAIGPGDGGNIEDRGWDEVRHLLSEISQERARQGSTPSEPATFVFSLKQPLFTRLRSEYAQ